MLNIKIFRVNPISENCYIVHDDTKEGVIIDCGCFSVMEWKEIKRYIDDNNIVITHMLNTHLHFDHIMGIPFVYDDLGINPEACISDKFLYDDLNGQMRMFFGQDFNIPTLPSIARALKDGDTISFGEHDMSVIQTPGHSPGSICLYCETENVLFSGDTLFQNSIGRTDLSGSSSSDMMNSLQRLSELPRNTEVYPGHGGKTNIGWECDNNPYFPSI